MMKGSDYIINLTVAHRGGGKSTTFSGRSEGKGVRVNLSLDEKDFDGNIYKVIMPSDTTSFNPSFFLGLFFDSVKNLGGIDRFNMKYDICLDNMCEDLKDIIQENLNECLRKAGNEYSDLTGLD